MPTRVLTRLIRRLLPDQRGNVALIVAAVFPLLIGAAGLAVDGAEWVLQKRQIQAATDSAAMAGVYSLIAEQDMQNAVSNTLSRDGSVPADASIQAEQSPAGHETDPFAVAVHVAVPARMTFSSMFMKHAPVITAEATASVVQNGEYCAFALGDDRRQRSRHPAQFERRNGVRGREQLDRARGRAGDQSSSLQSRAIVAYGAIDGKGAIHDSLIRPHSLAQKDPLEGTDPPLVPNTGCPRVTINPDNGGETALEPGCYADMFLNGNVRLQDGEYILNQGNFVVGPQGHVSCDACTIFLTSDVAATDPATIGKVKISSDATVKMNATREGPNAGILFYQDRHAARDLPGDENRVGGSSFSILKGILYFPSETLYLDGNMSPGPAMRPAARQAPRLRRARLHQQEVRRPRRPDDLRRHRSPPYLLSGSPACSPRR